jgi:hypothetical protein
MKKKIPHVTHFFYVNNSEVKLSLLHKDVRKQNVSHVPPCKLLSNLLPHHVIGKH